MAANLADLTYDELAQRVAEGKDELFKLRFQLATGQLTDVTALGRARKEIARAKTRMRQLEIAAAESQETR
jgi:large subunit ribosomal protein L29